MMGTEQEEYHQKGTKIGGNTVYARRFSTIPISDGDYQQYQRFKKNSYKMW